MISLLDLRQFINREKIYFYLLVFIVFFNIALVFSGPKEAEKEDDSISEIIKAESLAKEKVLKDPKLLMCMGVSTFFIFLVILSGIALDIQVLIKSKFKNPASLFQRKYYINWTLWDVGKVVILFTFFMYALSIIEGGFSRIFPLIAEKKNIRLVINITVHEIVALTLIFYFAFIRKFDNIKALGIDFKNFFYNIKFSAIRYIATLPFIAASLLVTIYLSKFFGYETKPQEVLKIFLKEDNIFFLIYMTVFTSFVGPVVEELFFRGFLYPALKKNIGVFWSIFLTSLFFSFLHGNIAAFLPILILGILLVYVYERTGSIISSITVHVIHNSSMLVFLFIFKYLTK